MKRFYLLLAFAVTVHFANAQQAIPITDSLPTIVDGLKIGYAITNVSEKEVGKKGNFSRHAVQFYVTNTGRDAKIILYKQGFSGPGSEISPNLVQFNCRNATGARLTSKGAILQAKPCNIMALVDDKECGTDKTRQNKRMVQIGYWIRGAETISNKVIIITPLNEKPDITAMVVADLSSPFSDR